jgi:hypothetical protein
MVVKAVEALQLQIIFIESILKSYLNGAQAILMPLKDGTTLLMCSCLHNLARPICGTRGPHTWESWTILSSLESIILSYRNESPFV